MEIFVNLLEVLNTLSPLAVIALLGVVILMFIYKNPFKPIETSLNEVKSNHLHDLPDIAANMEKVVTILQRMEVKMSEDFAHIKARINGRS